MKLFFRLVFGLLLICFTACEQGDNFVRPEGADALDDPHAVTVEAALGELNGLLAEIDPATRGGGRTVASVGTVTCGDVASPATRSGETPDGNLVHIVQFAGGGYAVLGADDRLPSIIAVVDEGELTAEAYAEMVRNGVPEDENGCPAVYPGIVFGPEIYELLGNDAEVSANVIPLSSNTIYGPWTTLKCDALIKTKWDQGEPYNMLTPQINGKQTLVGCVAVAVGQIMAYKVNDYGPIICPDNIAGYDIDWWYIFNGQSRLLRLSIQSSYSDILAVAKLLRSVGEAVGMEYGVDGSAAYSRNAAVCMANYGYSNVALETYNFEKVCSMLDLDFPVYISATDTEKKVGHAWVIDGYTFQHRTVEIVNPQTNVVQDYRMEYRNLLHCNFGWGGSKDGYYLEGIFDLRKGQIDVNEDEYFGTRDRYYNAEKRIITYTGYYIVA